MRPKRSTRWLFWLCLASASTGCNGEDADRLARVYHRTAAKFEDESAGTREKLSRGWHSLQGDPLATASLRDRVAARLRLDRALAEAAIEVDADGDIITLRGEVEQLLPEVEIADLPLEVHGWTGFLDEYTHMAGAETREPDLPETLSALLVSEACNVGLTPVADETYLSRRDAVRHPCCHHPRRLQPALLRPPARLHPVFLDGRHVHRLRPEADPRHTA